MKNLSKERTGEVLMLAQMFFGALTPILVRGSVNVLPPLFFAGISMVLASLVFLPILIYQGLFSQIFNKKVLPSMLIGTLIMMVIVFPLRFFAGQKISAGNLAILWQGEILFTFLLFGFLGFEKITKKRIVGAILITIGSVVILFKELSNGFQMWGLLIVLATAIAPFGNIYQKKVVRMISPLTYLFFRNFVGGIIVLFISFSFENILIKDVMSNKALFLIVANALIAFGLAKVFAFYALKRMPVSKMVALNAAKVGMVLFLAFLFLGEVPNLMQFFGFFVMVLGVYQIIDKVSFRRGFYSESLGGFVGSWKERLVFWR